MNGITDNQSNNLKIIFNDVRNVKLVEEIQYLIFFYESYNRLSILVN